MQLKRYGHLAAYAVIATLAMLLAVSKAFGATQTFTASDGAVLTYTPAPVAPPVVVVPPPVQPATSWVYHNGVRVWPGDFSYAVNQNYSDTSGNPAVGSTDILIQPTSPGGAWQPYFPGFSFSLKPYTVIKFTVKPTSSGQKFQVYFESSGDLPEGKSVDDVAQYCTPALAPGRWSACTVPLAAFDTPTSKVTGTSIMKFDIRDNSGGTSSFYLSEVGFQ